MVYPIPGDARPITQALASLAGSYSSVQEYDLVDFVWKLYDPTVLPEFAPLVNTLTEFQLGQSYWVYATQSITPVIPIGETNDGLPIGM